MDNYLWDQYYSLINLKDKQEIIDPLMMLSEIIIEECKNATDRNSIKNLANLYYQCQETLLLEYDECTGFDFPNLNYDLSDSIERHNPSDQAVCRIDFTQFYKTIERKCQKIKSSEFKSVIKMEILHRLEQIGMRLSIEDKHTIENVIMHEIELRSVGLAEKLKSYLKENINFLLERNSTKSFDQLNTGFKKAISLKIKQEINVLPQTIVNLLINKKDSDLKIGNLEGKIKKPLDAISGLPLKRLDGENNHDISVQHKDVMHTSYSKKFNTHEPEAIRKASTVTAPFSQIVGDPKSIAVITY